VESVYLSIFGGFMKKLIALCVLSATSAYAAALFQLRVGA